MFYILNPTNKSAARSEHVEEYKRHGYTVCVMSVFHLQIFTYAYNLMISILNNQCYLHSSPRASIHTPWWFCNCCQSLWNSCFRV